MSQSSQPTNLLKEKISLHNVWSSYKYIHSAANIGLLVLLKSAESVVSEHGATSDIVQLTVSCYDNPVGKFASAGYM